MLPGARTCLHGDGSFLAESIEKLRIDQLELDLLIFLQTEVSKNFLRFCMSPGRLVGPENKSAYIAQDPWTAVQLPLLSRLY